MQQTEKSIPDLIRDCKKGKAESQRELYTRFYNYAMSICLRYSKNRQEAEEIVNDGFIKVLTNLDKYNVNLSFKGWLRRIMINSAIDFFRRNEKHYNSMDIVYAQNVSVSAEGVKNLAEAEIMDLVQQLPPSYRIVFNLFVVEGYKHEEISQKLGISVGTSKSNLAKARMKLKLMLQSIYGEEVKAYG
ncbi:MAG: sigma-70 family RNA polymerase sigma factor [Bacteroidetes bacterium]|nr:sigma-70 family RNA polymerase sigma factor [Bacteroidota bacterium]